MLAMVREMKLLAKGKRGIVHQVAYKGKPAICKEKRQESAAINAMENEARWLKMLNKYLIGPKFYGYKDGKLIMEYVKGQPILEWLDNHKNDRKLIQNVMKNVLQQCFRMDQLQVEKKEMHRPVKHIIIRNNKPVLIDFERCRKTLKPSNVTQCCQFLKRLNLIRFDHELLKAYRREMSERTFRRLLACL